MNSSGETRLLLLLLLLLLEKHLEIKDLLALKCLCNSKQKTLEEAG
jgi:hypothetical protein